MFENINDSKNSGMDEILSSIRQTIHEDLQQVTTSTQSMPPEAFHQNTPLEDTQAIDQDILELTQSVQDDGSVVDLAALPSTLSESTPSNSDVNEIAQDALTSHSGLPGAVLNASDTSATELSSGLKDADTSEIQTHINSQDGSNTLTQSNVNSQSSKDTMTENQFSSVNESILSQETIQESMDALSALNALSRPQVPQGPQNFAHSSLEDVVKEALKPMLKQWLDAHLPELVKQIVREQIDKVFKKGSSQL